MEMGYLNGSHEHSVRGRGGPMARGRGGPPPPRYIARLIYVHTNCIESLLVWISWSVSTISLVIKLFKKKKKPSSRSQTASNILVVLQGIYLGSCLLVQGSRHGTDAWRCSTWWSSQRWCGERSPSRARRTTGSAWQRRRCQPSPRSCPWVTEDAASTAPSCPGVL